MKRKFSAGDVLTVTTLCMVSPRGMDGLYDILNHMTGQILFTHQLCRAAEAATPALFRRFPRLARVEKPRFSFPSDTSPSEAEAMVAAWVQEQGLPMEFEIEPLSPEEYVSMDHVEELVRLRGGKTDGILTTDGTVIKTVTEVGTLNGAKRQKE